MNQITLNGTLQDIKDSHTIGDVQYQKANLIVNNSNGKKSILNLQFKKFMLQYKEGDQISLIGNIRSYSQKVSEDRNHVSIYVFTYFDEPTVDEFGNSADNLAIVDGRICKIEPLRNLQNGKCNIHFIIANNILQNGSKLNSYIPCIAWGSCAKKISNLQKNDVITVSGELRSREYKKPMNDGSFEIRVAHELVVTSFEVEQDESQV